MPTAIGREDQRKLKRVVVGYFSNSPRAVAVLSYLFDRSITATDSVPNVSESELITECHEGPRTEGAVRSLMSRVRDDLSHFFEEEAEGRKQRWKVVIPQRDYALAFDHNRPIPRSGSGGLLRAFWTPYVMSSKPIHVLYSEPQFFLDSLHTYLHNVNATTADELELVGQYKSVLIGIKPISGFVAAGVVQALIQIFEFFQSVGTPVTASPLRPNMEMPETDHDLIVLASAGTARSVIARLQYSLPKPLLPDTLAAEPSVNSQSSSRMGAQESPTDGVPNFAVLTRRPHRMLGRSITVISAQHARAVEAVAWLVTKERELQKLAERFPESGVFPDFFQATVAVPILRTEAEPYIEPVCVRDVILLPPLGSETAIKTERA